MEYLTYEHRLANLIRNNFLFIVWGVLITLGMFWLGYKIDRVSRHQRSFIVPDHIARKIEFTDDHIPSELLEEYSEKVAQYAFNFTPATARARFGRLLQYFHPDSFPSAKKTFFEMADTIERTKVSSSFVINKPIEVDTEKKTITVSGAARLWVESKFIDTEEKTYIISYTITDSLFQLLSVDEKIKGTATSGEDKNAKK